MDARGNEDDASEVIGKKAPAASGFGGPKKDMKSIFSKGDAESGSSPLADVGKQRVEETHKKAFDQIQTAEFDF